MVILLVIILFGLAVATSVKVYEAERDQLLKALAIEKQGRDDAEALAVTFKRRFC